MRAAQPSHINASLMCLPKLGLRGGEDERPFAHVVEEQGAQEVQESEYQVQVGAETRTFYYCGQTTDIKVSWLKMLFLTLCEYWCITPSWTQNVFSNVLSVDRVLEKAFIMKNIDWPLPS